MENTLDSFLATVSQEDKDRFKENFFKMNPGWRGANVDDILENMQDEDSFLDVIEMFDEYYPDAGDEAKVQGSLHHAVRMACVLDGPLSETVFDTALRLIGR